jgi:hypothetical protein
MARNHSRRIEARRGNAEERRQGLAKRVDKLERKVSELTKEGPPRPEDTVARQARPGERADYLHIRPGNADYAGPVQQDMERMKGRSRSDLMSDAARGAGSPLRGRRV